MTEDVFIYKPGEYIDVVNTGVSFNAIGYDPELIEQTPSGSYKARRPVKVTLRVEETRGVPDNRLFLPMVCGMIILSCLTIFFAYWYGNRQLSLVEVMSNCFWLLIPLLVCGLFIRWYLKKKYK